MASRLVSDERTALDTLARGELGIEPEELGGSAWAASLTSCALFGIVALITLMTGRSVFFSGTRQFLVGLAAATLTCGVGLLIGTDIVG